MNLPPCAYKHRYPDKKTAQGAYNHAMRHRGRRGRAERLRIYPCPDCLGWHLTKRCNQ